MYNGSRGTLYVNKASSGSFNKNLNTNGAVSLVIGANSVFKNNEFFKGILDELRVYSRALSASEVADLYDLESVAPNRSPWGLENFKSYSTAVLAIQENQPIGTIIGEFNATDPDGHAIEFSYFAHLGNNIEPVLWYDASKDSSVIASSGAVSKWIDLSKNGYDLIQNTQTQKPSYGESLK